MHAIVHAADVQDPDGGARLMASLFGAFPFLLKLYADGGYQGPDFQAAMKKVLGRRMSGRGCREDLLVGGSGAGRAPVLPISGWIVAPSMTSRA